MLNICEFQTALAYFLYYGYLPLPNSYNCAREEQVRIACITLASAPWIGAISDRYTYTLTRLLDLNILKLAKPDFKDVPLAVFLSIDDIPATGELLHELKSWVEESYSMHRKRLLLHIDKGWSVGADNVKSALRRIIDCETGELVIKLVAYHGRTWFGVDANSGFIQDLLLKHPKITFKILLVDEHANEIVREGSTVENHRNASSAGLVALSLLPTTFRSRVDVRMYGRSVKSALMRGILIERGDGSLVGASITNWRFGYDRGIYGRELEFHPESSLALISNEYFNSVFQHSRPIGNMRRRLAYSVRRYAVSVGIGALPLGIVWGGLALDPSNGPLQFSTVISVLLAIWAIVVPVTIEKVRNGG